MANPTFSTPAPSAATTYYLLAILFIVLVGVVGILGILYLRPHEDNSQLIATLMGFLVPTLLGIMALIKVQETHLLVNSRMTELGEKIAKAERAEGVLEGVAQQKTTAKDDRRDAGYPPQGPPGAATQAQGDVRGAAARAQGVVYNDAATAQNIVHAAAYEAAEMLRQTAREVAAQLRATLPVPGATQGAKAGTVPVAVVEMAGDVTAQVADRVAEHLEGNGPKKEPTE
jgi:hypothetical protein